MTAIKLVITSIEWHTTLNEVEGDGSLDKAEKAKMVNAYKRKLEEYRIDPEDYS